LFNEVYNELNKQSEEATFLLVYMINKPDKFK